MKLIKAKKNSFDLSELSLDLAKLKKRMEFSLLAYIRKYKNVPSKLNDSEDQDKKDSRDNDNEK